MNEIVQQTPSGHLATIKGLSESQIETAKRFPRDISQCRASALAMAGADRSIAESCFWKRPVGRDRDGREIVVEGYSIRLAEIMAQAWGNIRVFVTLIEDGDRTRVRAHAIAWDLESNYAIGTDVLQPTVYRDGRPYDEQMRLVAASAALKKAQRDAIFAVIPKTEVKLVADQIRQKYASAVPIEMRRQKLAQWAQSKGIALDRILASVGRKSLDECTDQDLDDIRAKATAIEEGEQTIDEAFPPVEPQKLAQQPQQQEPKAQVAEPEPKVIEATLELDNPKEKIKRRLQK